MKPVIGLLLVFTGAMIGYMVITGKLPSSQLAPTGGPSGTSTKTSGGGAELEPLLDELGLSEFPAYIGGIL